jgi:transposase InsO family protein
MKKRTKDDKVSEEEIKLENEIIDIFRKSRNNYGTRKIKKKLAKIKIKASRRKIGRIMEKYSLISNYTIARYKPEKSKCNEEKIENVVNRNFRNRDKLEVIVSDLTYVRVGGKWCYICILLDLYNKEVIGYSAGDKKDADLVYEAFLSCSYPLTEIKIFHTDRGNEFKNKLIDEVITTFGMKRSLSAKGSPYDNAPVESFNNILKTECIKGKTFKTLEDLKLELMDYINWYNNHRIHGSLDYLTPKEYRERKIA